VLDDGEKDGREDEDRRERGGGVTASHWPTTYGQPTSQKWVRSLVSAVHTARANAKSDGFTFRIRPVSAARVHWCEVHLAEC
jgi:hypothetical protein